MKLTWDQCGGGGITSIRSTTRCLSAVSPKDVPIGLKPPPLTDVTVNEKDWLCRAFVRLSKLHPIPPSLWTLLGTIASQDPTRGAELWENCFFANPYKAANNHDTEIQGCFFFFRSTCVCFMSCCGEDFIILGVPQVLFPPLLSLPLQALSNSS